jgi:hypothetical protein
VVDTQPFGINRDVSSIVPSTQVVDTEQPEIYPAAGRAIFESASPIAEQGPIAGGSPTRGPHKAEGAWPVLPSELPDDQVEGEFSYQLMRAKLPGEIKIGILTEGFAGLTAAEALTRKREYLKAFLKLETGHG